jgi:GAF domain-containing protein
MADIEATLNDARQRLAGSVDMREIMAIVRNTGREIIGADAATFILREGEQVFYADESAIQPLWKGQRFPISRCIGGWSMVNRSPVVIPDLAKDARIPLEVYHPTFVKSLAVVPIGVEDPIGAIGTYWAVHHRATQNEIQFLEQLASDTFEAIVRVQNTETR